MAKRRNARIQYLRGILFLAVLGFHCVVPGFDFGWAGVQVFFVISSFFIVMKYSVREEISCLESIKDRIKKIYRPYLLVVLLSIGFGFYHYRILPVKDIISHVLLVQNLQWIFLPYNQQFQMYTQHLWTMCMEMWIGCSIIILLKKSKRPAMSKIAYVLIIIAVLYRSIMILCNSRTEVITLCPLTYLDSFGCGILLTEIIRNENKKQGYLICGVTGFLGILVSIYAVGKVNGVSYIEGYKLLRNSMHYMNNLISGNIFLFISLLSISIVGLLLSQEERNGSKINILAKGLLYLGNNSFLLYLVHWIVLVEVKRYGANTWIMKLMPTFFISVILVMLYNYFAKHLHKPKQNS